MEGNEKSKNKKKLIAIISSAAAVCVAAVVLLLILLPRDDSSDRPQSDSQHKEEIKPEKPVIPDTVVTAADEKELREYLKAEQDLDITVTGDVKVGAPLKVEGNKRVKGDVELSYYFDGIPEGYIIEIDEEASLVLEGTRLNGNYRAGGIFADYNSKLTAEAVDIARTSEAGIKADNAELTLNACNLHDLGRNGVFTKNESKVFINDGEYKGGVTDQVCIGSGGYLKVTGDPLFDGQGIGDLACFCIKLDENTVGDIRGGRYTNGSTTKSNHGGIQSMGKLDISYEGAKKNGYVEFYDLGYDAIRISPGATDVNISRINVKNVANNFIKHYSYTNLTIEDSVFDTSGTQGFYFNGIDATVNIYDCVLKNTKAASLSITGESGTHVKARNVRIYDSESTGVTFHPVMTGDNKISTSTCDISNFEIKNCNAGFNIYSGVKFNLSNGVIESCRQRGGGVNEKAVITCDDVTFTANDTNKNADGASDTGGAVFVNDGTFNADGCVFEKHVINRGGGCIAVNNGEVNLNDCKFTENSSGDGVYTGAANGAVLWAANNNPAVGTKINVTDCDFIGNTSNNPSDTGGGGVMYIKDKAEATFSKGCRFKDNVAPNGGVFYINGGAKVKTDHCSFEKNAARQITEKETNGEGGAVKVINGSFIDTGSVFENNFADWHGGAIKIDAKQTAALNDSEFIGNYVNNVNNAAGAGGAIAVSGSMEATDCRFTGNYVEGKEAFGGAISTFSYADSVLTFKAGDHPEHAIFEDNYSSEKGGGVIYLRSGTAKFDGYTFRDNTSGTGGGVAYIDQRKDNKEISTLTLKGCTVLDNRAGDAKHTGSANGGVIWAAGAKAKVNLLGGTSVKNNKAFEGGSGGGGAGYLKEGAGLIAEDCEFSGNQSVNGIGGAFIIKTDSSGSFKASSFTQNRAAGNGGALHISENTDIESTDVSFTENHGGKDGADNYGGAMYVSASTVDMTRNTFDNNEITTCGGAIALFTKSTLKGADSSFTENRTTAPDKGTQPNGGAIFIDEKTESTLTLTVTDAHKDEAKFEGNHANHAGGAIWSKKGAVNVTGYLFAQNTSGAGGGAVFVNSCEATFDGCTFRKNEAASADKPDGGNGGGVWAADDDKTGKKVTVKNCEFTENKAYGRAAADGGGAGFFRTNINLSVEGCAFTGNQAVNGVGGALVIKTNATAEIKKSSGDGGKACTFTNNTAKNEGGAVMSNDNTAITDSESVFSGNRSDKGGGAIYYNGSGEKGDKALTLKLTQFKNNTAVGNGGAVSLNASKLTGDSVYFEGNHSGKDGANSYGGAIYVDGAESAVTLKSDTDKGLAKFVNNVADNYEGDKGKETDSASHQGGALHLAAGTMEADGYTFTQNKSRDGGGAISLKKAKITLSNCVVGGDKEEDANEAGSAKAHANSSDNGHGGAIWASGEGAKAEVILKSTAFKHNSAKNNGGAVYIKKQEVAATLTVTSCDFTDNKAGGTGGVIHATDTDIILTGNAEAKSVISGNSAGDKAGAVYVTGKTLSISNYTFSGNTAKKGYDVGQVAGSAQVTVDESCEGWKTT